MKKQKPNFQCNGCKTKFYLQSYSITQSGKLKDKYGLFVKCDNCMNDHTYEGFTFIDVKKGVPELLGSVNGTFPKESELLQKKQDFTKLRSRHHFKNEILPTHPDRHLKHHFKKKYKNTKYVDHEKMKL